MQTRIAFIGAGSLEFSRKLIADLLSVPELAECEIALYDIDARNLDLVHALVKKDVAANSLRGVSLEKTLDRRKAVQGARYVFNLARIGGLEAFQHDIDIPLRYGVDQCVGDTICAGGIMYGQRTIPFILDVCKDLRECASHGVLLLNYMNPMAMNVWAASHYGGIHVVGLCHGVQNGQAEIAEALGLKASDLEVVCVGINHQTWYLKVIHAGVDVTPRLLRAFEAHPVLRSQEKVRIDVMRRFGFYSTESNGHLSEYLPWYRKRREQIKDWIATSEWIHGETGGYLRHCRQQRAEFEKLAAMGSAQPFTYGAARRSHEHGSYVIEALETGRLYRGHFNTVNRGCVPNLPQDAIIEAPGYAGAFGIETPFCGELPLGPAAICNASISVQRLAVQAAVQGNERLLKQAMMMDPLVGAVCTPQEIWDMTEEMLVAEAQWLPQYAAAVADLKSRKGG